MNRLPINGAFDGLMFIEKLSEVPLSSGVYYLNQANTQYHITKSIDFGGATVVIDNCSLVGNSGDMSGITNANVLINSRVAANQFKFQDCTVTIDALTGTYDWFFVNFYNSTFNIVNADNVVLNTCGFIDSQVKLIQSVQSVVFFPNCSFFTTKPNEILLELVDGLVVNRRVRVEKSIMTTISPTQTAIKVGAITIDDERFILEGVQIQGSGTAFNGINGDNPKALFRNVATDTAINSAAIGVMGFQRNTVPTPITVVGNAYKIVGTYTPDTVNQRWIFDAVNNVLECDSVINRYYRIIATISMSSNSNNELGGYICICRAGNTINPQVDKVSQSENYVPSATGTRPDTMTLGLIRQLSKGDRVYLAVENATAANAITVEFANLIIESTTI